MTNEEKAMELFPNIPTLECLCCDIRKKLVEMAEWKDQWIENLLTELMICAQQGYVQCASDEVVIKEMTKILKENEL